MTNRREFFWITIGILFFVFLFLIRSILLPFALGIFIAYFLDPVADRLEKTGMSRVIATIVAIISFFLIISVLIVLISPVFISQISGLVAALPNYVSTFEYELRPSLERWMGNLPMAEIDNVKNAMTNASGIAVKLAEEFIAGLFKSGLAFVNIVSLILITPVVAFYLVQDWDHIVAHVDQLLPRAHANTIRVQCATIDRTLAGFLRGQLNVCLILSVYYTALLSLTGLNFSIGLGIMTGFLVIVPYAGWLMGTIIGCSVALFQFTTAEEVGAVICVFLFGAVIEGYFLTPKLVGEKVGLHPVWIIFGMLSGAALFGFVGVLLAIPATAVIGVLIRFAMERYLQSDYYRGGAV